MPPALHDYRGALHLHSAHSHDGRRSVADITRAAASCRLDFICLTDHFTLAAKERGEDGWQRGVLVVVGEEVSPRYNHLLAFGLEHTLPAGEAPQGLIERVRAGGGVSFLAHPDHKGAAKFGVPAYPWRDWSVTGFTGLSIWDFMTDWQQSLTGYARGVAAYLAPAHALRGPEPETLERWDALGRERRVAGIAELDNHDTLKRVLGHKFNVFPFETAFSVLSTHALLHEPFSGEAARDEAALLRALANGRAYVCLEALGEGRGFEFYGLLSGGGRLDMGGEVPLPVQAELVVRLPQPARVSLLCDGQAEAALFGQELHHVAERPGVWRVECSLRRSGRWRPWIYSNPVYLR